MQVDVGKQVLVPRVKHCGEAGQSLEAPPSLGEFEKGLCGSFEEEIIEDFLVSADERVEFVGQRDDDVEVACGEQSLKALVDPLDFFEALTFWAVPVPAGVETQALESAMVPAGFEMASQGGSPATQDIPDDLALLRARRVALEVVIGVDSEDVGYFNVGRVTGRARGARHIYDLGLHAPSPLFSFLASASHGLSMVARKALLTCRYRTVVRMDVCPSSFCTKRTSVPFSSRCVA